MTQTSLDDGFIPDEERRRLTLLTASVGGVGLLTAAVPLVAYQAPSERAKSQGAPVEVSLDGLGEEPLRRSNGVASRCGSCCATRRNPAQLARLAPPDVQRELAAPTSRRREQQPKYAVNVQRSKRPEIGVHVALVSPPPPTGRVAFTAPATARTLIWRAGHLAMSPHQATCSFLPIATRQTRSSKWAWTKT